VGIVYLNGRHLPQEEALVSVNDRGFLFADGVYEVTPAYRGNFFLFDRHRERLLRGLCALRIDADLGRLEEIHAGLLDRNDLTGAEVSVVYLQITRGVAPRTHAFPAEPVPPTVYAFAKEFVRPDPATWEAGYAAVTVPDRRWSRADVKSISLLPNVLAQQAASDAGVSDAVLVKDGVALEGAHNNFFAVFGDTVVTHPLSNVVLPGITRTFVVEMAREMGIPVEERPIQLEELAWATETFFTGTTTEIRPTVRIDGRPVGEGRVGPVTRRLAEAFRRRTDACAADG
jgi:D-alanine transaminase